MTFDDWMLIKDKSYVPTDDSMQLRLLRECWFSRDDEIAYLLEANRIACEDLVEQQNLRVKYAGQIEELVSALEDNWNCNPCETTRQQKAFDVAQSVLAKVRKPT